jgi:hypothetical protein
LTEMHRKGIMENGAQLHNIKRENRIGYV